MTRLSACGALLRGVLVYVPPWANVFHLSVRHSVFHIYFYCLEVVKLSHWAVSDVSSFMVRSCIAGSSPLERFCGMPKKKMQKSRNIPQVNDPIVKAWTFNLRCTVVDFDSPCAEALFVISAKYYAAFPLIPARLYLAENQIKSCFFYIFSLKLDNREWRQSQIHFLYSRLSV